jgi:hypothetical protein
MWISVGMTALQPCGLVVDVSKSSKAPEHRGREQEKQTLRLWLSSLPHSTPQPLNKKKKSQVLAFSFHFFFFVLFYMI